MTLPCPALRPYIKVFHIIESHGEPLENRVLPDTAMALAQAIQLAKRCPILDYGGSVEVRERPG